MNSLWLSTHILTIFPQFNETTPVSVPTENEHLFFHLFLLVVFKTTLSYLRNTLSFSLFHAVSLKARFVGGLPS